MDLIYLLFLFVSALVFTLVFAILAGNRGPWNNPMFFFLVLFLTSWAITIWMAPNIYETDKATYLYGTGVTAIVALLLAASETPFLEPIRKVKSKTRLRKFLWISRSNDQALQVRPNVFFWILLAIESCMIMTAYFLQYKQNAGI
jgi:hypothetical protein